MDGVHKMKMLCLLAVLILGFGCSRTPSRPELAKVNENGTTEWKRFEHKEEGQPDLVYFGIKAGNRIDTPAGEKVAQFGISCGGNITFNAVVGASVAPENGDVKMGFDDAALVSKTWHPIGTTINITEADQNDFLRQLRNARTFQFEFTPKGGKPQLSTFKLLNINSLIDQEKSCKWAIEHLR